MNPPLGRPTLPIVPRRITVTPAAKKRRDRQRVPGIMSLLSECHTKEKVEQLFSYAHMKCTDASEDTKNKWKKMCEIRIRQLEVNPT